MASESHADVVVIGGGTGGCAAALSALRAGFTVIMTEETTWVGGQLTSQAIPPDENLWIEEFPPTASYGEMRSRVRDYYRRSFPLSATAAQQLYLNPGNGEVGPLCADPRAFLAAIHEMLAPFTFTARLRILHRTVLAEASVLSDEIQSVRVVNLLTDEVSVLVGKYFLDGTDTGDLINAAGAEHVTGAEAQADTDEPHAPDTPKPDVMEAFSWGLVCDYEPTANNTIERPREYDHYVSAVPQGWTAPQLSWGALYFDTDGVHRDRKQEPRPETPWPDRRILDRRNLIEGFATSDVACINHFQNVYLGGPAFGPDAEHHREMARQLSLSLVYWLQTEAERPDGGNGFPGLRLRPDATGSGDGLAQAPYIRESRRIIAEQTVREQDVSIEFPAHAVPDSVGIAHYFIDMWPRTNGEEPFLIPARPAQIPIGSLIPVRLRNLIPAAKNAGFTQITNSIFRMHAGEWAIGEAAGGLAAHCIRNRIPPTAVRASGEIDSFQTFIHRLGIRTAWPNIDAVRTWQEMVGGWRRLGEVQTGVLETGRLDK